MITVQKGIGVMTLAGGGDAQAGLLAAVQVAGLAAGWQLAHLQTKTKPFKRFTTAARYHLRTV